MRIGPRLSALALGALGACACLAAGTVGMTGACIVVPPPDLGAPSPHRPEILHASVQPPTGVLSAWPPDSTFLVPLHFEDPVNDEFEWDAFVEPISVDSPAAGQLQRPERPTPSALDAGVTLLQVPIPQPDLTQCLHVIVYVAHAFAIDSKLGILNRVFDSVGGDTVDWVWVPRGGCAADAGSPISDASSDGLPVPPIEAGADP